jgi:pimeloyl-ACP methyl ester carboxylesterase
MKTVLFIPGYYENIDSRDYKAVLKAIESKGYVTKFVPINWVRTTIDDWVNEFETVYTKYDPKNTILAGFSFGAMIALCAASKINPIELWLFSLSPYFYEDLPMQKKSHLAYIGHRRVSAFNKLIFSKSAKSIKCKTLLFIGEIERAKFSDLFNRVKEANKQIKDSNLLTVENAGHDVSNKNYIDSILGNI